MDVTGADGIWSAEVVEEGSWPDDGSLYAEGVLIEAPLSLIAETTTRGSPPQVLTIVYTGCTDHAVTVDGIALEAACGDISWEGADDVSELDAEAETLPPVGGVTRGGCAGTLSR